MPNETPVIPAEADPGLSLEEMKTFVRDYFEDFVNQKKSEVALKNFSDDFLDHDEPCGVADWRAGRLSSARPAMPVLSS